MTSFALHRTLLVALFALIVAGCQKERAAASPTKGKPAAEPSPQASEAAKTTPVKTVDKPVVVASQQDPADLAAASTPTRKPWHRAGYRPPSIIDFHGHLGLSGADRIERFMRVNGLGLIINLSGGSSRQQGAAWQRSLALSKRLPGKIVHFVNINWRGCCSEAWQRNQVKSIRFAATRLGFVGLKISKALGLGAVDESGKLVAVDDPRLDPIWEEAARHHLPVSIHVADPLAFWQPVNPQNERWDELKAHPGWSYHGEAVPSWEALLDAAEAMFKRNAKTTFVAVHFGNAAEDIERVDRMLSRLPNVYIDLAARFGEFGRHKPDRVRAFFTKHQDRILFGTDIGVSADYLMLGSNGEKIPTDADVQPFYDAHFRYLESNDKQIDHPSPIQGNWKIEAIGLPAAILQKVYRDNALALLGRVKPAKDPPESASPAKR